MMDEVLYEVKESVAVVTLNRPEKLNALNLAMHERLEEVWANIKGDGRVKAIVVAGTGRGFCVGLDLQQVGSTGRFRPTSSNRISDIQKMTALNNDIWLPTIAAINGVCAGGGLHFVADADVVIASKQASFVDSHVSVGQVSALEPISLIPRIGLGNALALSVMGNSGRIDADTALRIGLVNEVVAHDDLMSRALEVAYAAAQASPAAVEGTKRAIWAALDRPMTEAMQLGWEMLVAHRSHPDALEGPRAFAEKRPAQWDLSPSPIVGPGEVGSA
jgi:enoyl-CoA hydratase/carnithine racemase